MHHMLQVEYLIFGKCGAALLLDFRVGIILPFTFFFFLGINYLIFRD